VELLVLGTGAAAPGPGQGCSGYLVTEGATRLLLDCGSGVVSRLREAGEWEKLTVLLLTHLHADHCLDLFCLYYSRKYAKGKSFAALPVFLPPGETDRLARLSEVLRVEPNSLLHEVFEVSEYDPAGLQVGELWLRFARTDHPVPTYAVRVEGRKASLVYSSDTAPTANLEELATGCDLLLSEATLSQEDFVPERRLHLTPGLAAEVARRAGVRQLLLTHLWPDYSRQEMLEQAQRVFPATELAEELRRYGIPQGEEE